MGEKIGRIAGLDYAKLIAAFVVIAIHTSPLEEINKNLNYYIVYVIGRIAVPLFFMSKRLIFRYYQKNIRLLFSSRSTLTIHI